MCFLVLTQGARQIGPCRGTMANHTLERAARSAAETQRSAWHESCSPPVRLRASSFGLRIEIVLQMRICLVAAAVCVASPALAQTRQPANEPGQTTGEATPANAKPTPTKRKPVKSDQARNYQQPPGTEPEDVALFVPRLILAIPRYALKAVFYPIRETIRFVDKHALVERVEDVLYNDARTAAILPTLSIDSFMGPTLGLKAFHEDLAGHHEYASAEAKFGGLYKLATQLHFRADRFGGSALWFESVSRFESEPGLLFQGIGNGALTTGAALDPREGAVATRFSEQRLLSLQRVGYTFGRPGEQLQVGTTGTYNIRDFGAKQRGTEPSIEQVYDTKALVGFADRTATLEADLNVIVDLRDVSGATASGGYFEAFAGRVPALGGKYSFWHHGAEITGYIDLYRRSRVLVLRAVVEGVEGDDQQIPFAELPRLGGPHRLRGYRLDRFRDEKAAVGTAEYHYPIHQYVAGSLFVDVGRVEHSYSDFFDAGWKAGAGGGFIFRSRDKQWFAFDIAYGEGVQFYVTTDPLRAFSKRDTEL